MNIFSNKRLNNIKQLEYDLYYDAVRILGDVTDMLLRLLSDYH